MHSAAYAAIRCLSVTFICCVETSKHIITGRANLRSAEGHDMLVPLTRTQVGRRSFHVAAPAVWNALPPHLRSSSISRGQFRAGLKTHLFTQAIRTPLRTFAEERIILLLHV